MNSRKGKLVAITVASVFGMAWLLIAQLEIGVPRVSAQTTVPPAAVPQQFDQAAAVAKIRSQIKGREQEPATAVFKNIQTMKNTPAGRLLAIMEMGFGRSLGVNCTHCHVPDKWEAEDKPQKQIARDMSDMVSKINRESLKAIKNLRSENPIVNCTTCHRGEIKPALNLPSAK
jgi:hypothetical protein